MVWQREPEDPLVKPALLLFFVHLVFNVLWSAFFFSMRSPGFALADILLLMVLILAVILVFYRIKRLAGLLLIPYLAWVMFAALLNGAIWWLNRAA
jgi:tryptophan-rich sensory protein